MSDVEKMMDTPLGSIGGPEYIKQEQAAAEQILRQRVDEAITNLQRSLETEDSELRKAKIETAKRILDTALGNMEQTEQAA